MEFLVLKLQGLMMSFGEGDHWDVRGTSHFPTKSFIVGLIAAGLGKDRSETNIIRKISSGISVACLEEKHPEFLRDYHTILDTMLADAKMNENAVISPRHYLADGVFIVLIGIKNTLIKEMLLESLQNPVWPPYLGRKSCIPSAPIFNGEIINAKNDYEAFKQIVNQFTVTEKKKNLFACVGEFATGRMSYIKDEVISLEPRIYKDRKVYYYTLAYNENTV